MNMVHWLLRGASLAALLASVTAQIPGSNCYHPDGDTSRPKICFPTLCFGSVNICI